MGIKINKATYYDPNIGSKNGTDVTKELSSEIRGGQLFYKGVYNLIFLDNFKSIRKKLEINFEYNGKNFTKYYNEDEKIDLPNELGIKHPFYKDPKFLISIIITFATISSAPFWWPQNNQPIVIAPTPTVAPTNLPDANQKVDYQYKYPSQDGKYTLYLSSEVAGHNLCFFKLEDQDNNTYDLASLLGSDRIACYEGMGMTSAFKRWLPQDLIVLDDYTGETKIVDPEKMQLTKYSYDKNKYDRFVDVDNTLEYWVFHKKSDSFAVLDKDGGEIKSISEIYADPLYDGINNGFLLIGPQKLTEDKKYFSQSFYFLYLPDLNIENVLNTEMNTVPPATGCYYERIASKTPGEVVIAQGCNTLRTNEKYLDSGSKIVIKL